MWPCAVSGWSQIIKDSPGTNGLASSSEHLAAAAVLREQYRQRPAVSSHLDIEVQVADLGAYDAAFGTGEEVA